MTFLVLALVDPSAVMAFYRQFCHRRSYTVLNLPRSGREPRHAPPMSRVRKGPRFRRPNRPREQAHCPYRRQYRRRSN